MEELCLILREKRMKRGAIDFDFEESKIILNNTLNWPWLALIFMMPLLGILI